MEDTPETASGRCAVCRTVSQGSLACYSVDENVLDVLWDEEVEMEELLGFSFEHIDKLAARRGRTVTSEERARLWEYVERMRMERDSWITKDSIDWDAVKARYALRTRSLSLSSLPGDLQLSGIGAQTPPPLLYSTHKLRPPQYHADASGGAGRRKAVYELQPGESLTQSEVWDLGSPRRRDIATLKQESAKKKHGWQSVLKMVFHNKSKQSTAVQGLGEFDEFLSGVAVTSSPSPATSASASGGPPPPACFDKGRQTGFLRRSLRRVAMATKKKEAPAHKSDKV